MDWVDLALLPDEATLSGAIENLNVAGRADVTAKLLKQLGIGAHDFEKAMLRILVERARPFVLPTKIWARLITSSDDPRPDIRENFKRRGVTITDDRVRQALQMYRQYAEGRYRLRVSDVELKRCGYRCEHCGLAFCDQELARRALRSPFGMRKRDKVDPMKPHWNGKDSDREPVIDHHWPIVSYGDNKSTNQRVLCQACNEAKSKFLVVQQMPGWAGMLVEELQLTKSGPLKAAMFYAQLWRSPSCERTGKGPAETELTVELRDPHNPAVLDNLMTVESPD